MRLFGLKHIVMVMFPPQAAIRSQNYNQAVALILELKVS